MDTIPNGTIQIGHHLEWTPSRMDTIANGHNPESTPFRMTQSRINTCNYMVALVFYSYRLVKSLLRRGFKQKLIL